MNKRIKELVKQVAPNFGENQKWAIVGETDIEKFAELIVRECMKVCQDTSIREDDGQNFVYSDAIQEHFRS